MENDIPSYPLLIEATYNALKQLGGSGKNDEIYQKSVEILNLSDDVLNLIHTDTNMTEVQYRLAWARTCLKNYSAIANSSRSVWSINPKFTNIDTINGEKVYAYHCKKRKLSTKEEIKVLSERSNKIDTLGNDDNIVSDINLPEEVKSWKQHLHKILLEMNPYAFERLTQRLLRECGFSEVKVTKKSGDGGIDGIGKLKINGIVTFNIAFQCKRYKGTVAVSEIRDFRGSLTTDIEKALFITTGTFTQQAIEDACKSGKQQIDLMDGEEFINKLAELQLGVLEIKDYQINEEFFLKI